MYLLKPRIAEAREALRDPERITATHTVSAGETTGLLFVADGDEHEPEWVWLLLSHLFAQATVSAECLLGEPAFREKFQARLSKEAPTFAPLLDEPIRAREFCVVLALITDHAPTGAPARALPFFSRLMLRIAVQRLRNMWLKVYIDEIARTLSVPPPAGVRAYGGRRKPRHLEAGTRSYANEFSARAIDAVLGYSLGGLAAVVEHAYDEECVRRVRSPDQRLAELVRWLLGGERIGQRELAHSYVIRAPTDD